MDTETKSILEAIFRAGVDACRPGRVLAAYLPPPPPGRTLVVAFGKAAAAMARVAETGMRGPLSGVAVLPRGTPAVGLEVIKRIEGGHPLPDAGSVAAARQLLDIARSASADDLVLVLLSGGASALACLPGAALALEEKRDVTAALLDSGAGIAEINCVRRHLSAIKGGRLALAAAPARLITLAISDVPGDRPEDIGSGPTAPDPTSLGEAHSILDRFGIPSPECGWSETPDGVPGEYRIVAGPGDALAAAAAEARRRGLAPIVLGPCTGDALETGRRHAEQALALPAGSVLLSGGELDVRVSGSGRGGRNRAYALAAGICLAGDRSIAGLAADSDGIDGTGPAAGAWFDGTTAARSNPDPIEALATSNSGSFFDALGDALVTGPTDTNVGDLRILLVRR